MKCFKAPPYILGLPQWPGSSLTPLTGQAFAEWHADKTVTVGAETFAEDVCGDYFPSNGRPLPTYCVQGNGIDISVEANTLASEVTSIELWITHQNTSSGALCGAYASLSSKLCIFYSNILNEYHLLIGGTYVNLDVEFSMTDGNVYKILATIAPIGEQSTFTIKDLITDETIDTKNVTPVTGTIPANTMRLFQRGNIGSEQWSSNKIMYAKFNDEEIFLTAGTGDKALNSSRQGLYTISGTLTTAWQPFKYPNTLNYTSHCRGASGRYVGSTPGIATELSIENLGYPVNKLFEIGDPVPADTVTARNAYSFSDLLGTACVDTGKDMVSKLPFSLDFVYAVPGDEKYPMILAGPDSTWDIDIYTSAGTTVLEWYGARTYTINVDAMLPGRVYRVTLQRDPVTLTDMQIVISLIKNDGTDTVDSVFGTLQIHDAVEDEYVWYSTIFTGKDMVIGDPSMGSVSDNQLYFLKFKSGDNEEFFFNSEADKRIFGSLGNFMEILFTDDVYDPLVWVECPVTYKSLYTGTKEYYISEGGEVYDDLYVARAGTIIPEDVTKTPNPPTFVNEKDYCTADYIGRTQFPLKVIADTAVILPVCYETNILYDVLGLSFPSSILMEEITNNIEDANVLFFSTAGQFERVDTAVAFLSARAEDTLPTKSQVEGYLGI